MSGLFFASFASTRAAFGGQSNAILISYDSSCFFGTFVFFVART